MPINCVEKILVMLYNNKKGDVFMARVSPSILGVDYLELSEKLKILEQCNTDMLHLDVMDGNFVPNISFGLPVIKSIKKHTNLLLDIHLMINEPLKYIEDFAKYADYLCFHYEAGSDILATLERIKSLGVKVCLSIKPNTKVEEIFEFLPLLDMVLVMSVEPGFGGQVFLDSALFKIKALRERIDSLGLSTLIEVDGGINGETAKLCVQNGADVLVAGNYIFNSSDIEAKVLELKSI